MLGSGPRISLQGIKVEVAKLSPSYLQGKEEEEEEKKKRKKRKKEKKELSLNRPRNFQTRL